MTVPGPSAGLENDHNVYILGAGFSVEAGLPVIGNFLTKMRDGYDWLQAQGRSAEAEAVKEVLEYRRDAASAALRVILDPDNIEHLFSLASATGEGRIGPAIRLAIAATLDFADATAALPPLYLSVPEDSPPPGARCRLVEKPHRIFEDHNDHYEVSPYGFYLGAMLGIWRDRQAKGQSAAPPSLSWTKPRNSIITFNYDLVVERALTELGLSCNYGFHNRVRDERGRTVPAGEPVALHKLHGSLNWADTEKLTEDEGAPDEVAEITVLDEYREVRDRGWLPLLLPPTWNKRFTGQLARTWTGAVEALRTATRVIIIGFSMPQTDVHFRYLLGAGLQHNISLRRIRFVNPDVRTEDFQRRVADLFRSPHLLEGLEEGKTSREFFMLDATTDDAINRKPGPGFKCRDRPAWR